MKTKTLFIFFLGGVMFASCNSNINKYVNDDFSDEEFQQDFFDEYERNTENSSQTHYVKCQMCNGTGFMRYFDGTMITCISCNGTGYVNVQQLQDVIDGNSNPYSSSSDYIEEQIRMKEIELENCEKCLEICDYGSVYYSYYSSRVISLKSEIRALNNQLNNF